MITSSLKEKGLRVVGGTTLISEKKATTEAKKGGEHVRYKHIQALVNPSIHKTLKFIALEQDITLAELFLEIINLYLKQKKEN